MFDQVWTKEVLDELMRRSAEGQGVKAAIAELGLDPEAGIEWLHKYHQGRVNQAKKDWINLLMAKDAEKRALAAQEAVGAAKPEA